MIVSRTLNLIARIAAIGTLTAIAACQTTDNADKPQTLADWHQAAEQTSKPAPERKKAAVTASAKDGRPFASIIAKYAAENGVPVDLAHAVVFSESSYRSGARGAAGEIGLMQLRMPTARMVGYSGGASALYDPHTNIKYGMRYLGGAYRLADGSVCGTILRYNAGHGARRMNPISQRYCNKVRKLLRDN